MHPVVLDDNERRDNVRAAANARRIAIDLANGSGRMDDPEDEFYRQSAQRSNDDRRIPLVWEEHFCLMYTAPHDGFASFGRRPHPIDNRFIPRHQAIMKFQTMWDCYEHLGTHVPPARQRLGTITSRPAAPAVTRQAIRRSPRQQRMRQDSSPRNRRS